jgi:superfamily II DNA or RNA helicase
MLDVDLTEYNKLNQIFIGFFSQMNYDFELAMKCATDAMYRNKIAKKLGLKPKELAGIAFGWLKALKGRKAFVQSHPKKFEIARKILDARKDKKCITFSATIKDAEFLNNKEFVLHSKKSKKQNNEILELFNNATVGTIHSSKSCDQGVDIRGLSVGIILSTDSSKIRKTQRNGRICRFEEGKTAELFTLVIRGTQE